MVFLLLKTQKLAENIKWSKDFCFLYVNIWIHVRYFGWRSSIPLLWWSWWSGARSQLLCTPSLKLFGWAGMIGCTPHPFQLQSWSGVLFDPLFLSPLPPKQWLPSTNPHTQSHPLTSSKAIIHKNLPSSTKLCKLIEKKSTCWEVAKRKAIVGLRWGATFYLWTVDLLTLIILKSIE